MPVVLSRISQYSGCRQRGGTTTDVSVRTGKTRLTEVETVGVPALCLFLAQLGVELNTPPHACFYQMRAVVLSSPLRLWAA